MSRLPQWLKALAAALIMLAVAGVVLELGAKALLRMAPPAATEAPIKAHDLSQLDLTFRPDPFTWWLLKPDLKNHPIQGRCWGRDVAFSFSTNAQGFRGGSMSAEGEKIRILALGDSLTFVLGVGDAECWPARLEARLNAQAGQDIYEVINAGAPGFSAFQGLRLLDKYGLALKPKLVIACFGQNDFDTWNPQTDLQKARAEAEARAAEEQSPSDLFVLARRALQGAEQVLADPNAPKQPRLTREEFRDTLEQLRQLCEQNGIAFVLLRWPQEGQVLEKRPAPINYEDVLLDFAQTPGVRLVDLYPAFAAKEEPLYADPVHGNAAGCDAAAEAMAAPVREALAL